MGQYFKPVSVDKMQSLYSHDYGNLSKLMEHSYIGNDFVKVAEYLLSPKGQWHMHSFVWAGDYADNEIDKDNNLFMLTEDKELKIKNIPQENIGNFIVNHTQKQYVDKSICPTDEEGWCVHPLPLLTADGNGRGGGDYRLHNVWVGSWAKDVISVEKEAPEDYTEIVPNFKMD